MDRFHLKNAIIVILAAVNLFLLGAIGWRLSIEYAARERTLRELTERLASQNVTLSANLPESTPPIGRVLRRSADTDAALAQSLLGDTAAATDLGGGITRYTSQQGQAVFRSNGSFDASGSLGTGTAEAFCRSLCRRFSLRELAFAPDGRSASARQSFDGLTVINASVTFHLEDSRLIGAEGILLPGMAEADGESSAMTAVTAVSTFLEYCRTDGVVVSAITDITPCYTLQNTAASTMTLTPAWLLATDAGAFFVDCLTAQVSRA